MRDNRLDDESGDIVAERSPDEASQCSGAMSQVARHDPAAPQHRPQIGGGKSAASNRR